MSGTVPTLVAVVSFTHLSPLRWRVQSNWIQSVMSRSLLDNRTRLMAPIDRKVAVCGGQKGHVAFVVTLV